MKKEALIRLYSEYRLLIFPIVVALSSLFLIIFAIYPQTIKLIENQKLALDFTNKSKFLETKVIALESFDEADLSKKTSIALSTFPSEKDYGNILGLMQQLIAESGFSITSISLGEGGKLNQADSYTVKLQVQGARVLFQTLLSNLEKSPRLMKISTIDISANQASQTADVSLAIDVFYSGLSQNFGAVDSPLPQIEQKEEELLANLARANEAGSSSLAIEPSISSSPKGKSNPFE